VDPDRTGQSSSASASTVLPRVATRGSTVEALADED
jgi:hypothetical protein